jgi:hypothetical protein
MSTFNDDDENISLSLSGYREKKKQKEDAVADGAEDVVDSEPEKINLKAVVADLAKLDPLEYDQIRVEQAARIGVRPNTLDRAVKDLRAHKASPENKEKDRTDFLIDPIPWDHAVDGAGLLDAISDVAASHLILPLGAAETIALWSLLAHAHDCFNISPILAAISPTPECGKTTLLTLLTGLVPRPLPASNVTPAVMFRAIEKWDPLYSSTRPIPSLPVTKNCAESSTPGTIVPTPMCCVPLARTTNQSNFGFGHRRQSPRSGGSRRRCIVELSRSSSSASGSTKMSWPCERIGLAISSRSVVRPRAGSSIIRCR